MKKTFMKLFILREEVKIIMRRNLLGRKLIILVTALIMVFSVHGCSKTETVANSDEVEVKENQKIKEGVIEPASEEVTETVQEADPAGYYEYKIFGEGSKNIDLNVPKGFYYDKKSSTNTSFRVCQGDISIRIESATSQFTEGYENYYTNGGWGWDSEEILEGAIVETKYGNVKLLYAKDKEDDYKREYGLLDKDGDLWAITRINPPKQPSGIWDFQDICNTLSEIFTAKSENTEDDILEIPENIHDYNYILSNHTEKIFGFSLPEEFGDGFNEGTSSGPYGTDLESITFKDSESGNIVTIELQSGGNYLQIFSETGFFEEGLEGFNMSGGYKYKILSLENKDIINTPFGKAQVIYQIIEIDDFLGYGEYKRYEEVALFNINQNVVTVTYTYYSSEEVEYQGKLLILLPEMLEVPFVEY